LGLCKPIMGLFYFLQWQERQCNFASLWSCGHLVACYMSCSGCSPKNRAGTGYCVVTRGTEVLSSSARLSQQNCDIYIYIYRVSQEECARLRDSVSYVKVYRYNPKHLYPKLIGYGDNGQRKVRMSLIR
jgi:hypothetical protein